MKEELCYKIEIAEDILNSRKAEAQVIQYLLAEATASVALREAQVSTREAEVKLAASRENEAKRRLKYFSRLKEVALENVSDAEMQAALLHVEGRKVGIQKPEPDALRVKDFASDADISTTLD
ncbi:hypothetical protein B0H13DRAFT_2323611 [Mycena leptocephala]|nr:hypothetical protein B0H13DRAFT_2345140 [Mycena leptocephala]KAJ7910232.1 hypothetical protein B0H13DRAFT_2329509 [Mycena leptocephala]KAJ7916119.1 hypothetical protein B0H13DRAFT_2323611 [Mycena leptocephala]